MNRELFNLAGFNRVLKILRIIFVSSFLTTASLAQGGDTGTDDAMDHKFSFHINGTAYHFSRNNQNEENYGAGLSYHYRRIESKYWLLNKSELEYELDIYRDSYKQTGYASGFAWKRPLNTCLKWGLKAGVVHEEHASDTSGMFFIPYLLPFVETHGKSLPVNIRMTLTPPVGDITDGMVMFQLMVPFL